MDSKVAIALVSFADHSGSTRRSGEVATVENTNPLRVLLVEDSPLIRERLAESLVDPGRIEIVGQADAEDTAISLLSDRPWDVLVLDLQLKRGTGLAVLRALVAGRPPGSKVIVLTNYAFPQYRAKSLALGADFFFDKAREYHRVRDVLEGILGAPMSAPG